MKVRLRCGEGGKVRVRQLSERGGSAGEGVGRPPRSGALEDEFAVAGGWGARADAVQRVDSRCGVAAAGPQRPEPARRACRRKVAVGLLVRVWWQRHTGAGRELHGAPAPVWRAPHPVDRRTRPEPDPRPLCSPSSLASGATDGPCRSTPSEATRASFAGRGDVDAWIEETVARCREELAFLFDLTANEREFLDGVLDRGDVDAALLDLETEICARIEAMPMLAWKSQHVQTHRALDR